MGRRASGTIGSRSGTLMAARAGLNKTVSARKRRGTTEPSPGREPGVSVFPQNQPVAAIISALAWAAPAVHLALDPVAEQNLAARASQEV